MTIKDLPDYTREMIIRYAGGFIGLEELATRLKSIVPWDVQGNVIFMEDFESELTEWVTGAVGTGSSVARSSAHKFSGDWSLLLVAGDEVDAYVTASRDAPYPGNAKLAIFCLMGIAAEQREVDFEGATSDTPSSYQFGLRYHGEEGKFYYMDENGDYQELGTAYINIVGPFYWNSILLVVDLSLGKYVRAVCNGVEYDMSDKTMFDSGASGPGRCGVNISARAIGALGTTVNFDDIIILKNVP